MSKKLLIISSLILIIFIVALASYYFLIQSNTKIIQGTKPSLVDFFPFGDNSTPDTTNSNTNPNPDNIEDPVNNEVADYTKKLRLISKEPVSGFTFVENKEGSIIRYVEKATGHIYDVSTYSNYKQRISNTTIPKIYTSIFANNGKELFAQYLNDSEQVETFYAPITSTTSEKAISNGSILNGNIKEIASSLKGNVFYIENDFNGSLGFISTPTNKTRKQIWSFPLKDFTGSFANDNTFVINTKPNSSEPGFAYKLDINTGKKTPIIQDTLGLSTKAGNDSIIFFTSINNGSLYYYSLKNNNQKQLSPKTFSDKCVFSKKEIDIVVCGVPKENITGNSLDSWYIGTASFSDDIWKYDTKNGVSDYVISLETEAKEKIDVDLIDINQKGDTLIFRNKSNGSLWSLNLN